MKLKNLTKNISIIFIFLTMLLACQPTNEDNSNNDNENTDKIAEDFV